MAISLSDINLDDKVEIDRNSWTPYILKHGRSITVHFR
jgi:hypothetical protein